MAMKRFSNTKSMTKGNIDKVPGNKPGVYRLKNKQGDILYIGKAKGGRLNDRIAEHREHFLGATQFQYRTTKTKESADRLERQEISKYIPPRNKRR